MAGSHSQQEEGLYASSRGYASTEGSDTLGRQTSQPQVSHYVQSSRESGAALNGDEEETEAHSRDDGAIDNRDAVPLSPTTSRAGLGA